MRARHLVIAFAVVVPLSARADNKSEAKDHLAKAAAAYKAERWQEVLDELNRANALDPDPSLHYSIGQVYAKMDRCSDALVSYQQYLDSKPSPDRVQVAEEAIAACNAILAAKPPPEPPPPPVVVQPPPPPPPESPHRERWSDDKVGVALVGGGAVLVLSSAIAYGLARGDLGEAEKAATYGEQVDKYNSARSKRLVSVVLGLGGVAALGAGGYHYYAKRREQRGLAVVPTRDGGFVTWSGGF